jgi:hypothetical protein
VDAKRVYSQAARFGPDPIGRHDEFLPGDHIDDLEISDAG